MSMQTQNVQNVTEAIRESAHQRMHQPPGGETLREAERIAGELAGTPGIRIVPRSINGGRTALEINGRPGSSIFLVLSPMDPMDPMDPAAPVSAGAKAHAVICLEGRKKEPCWPDSTVLPGDTVMQAARAVGAASPAGDAGAEQASLSLLTVVTNDWLRIRLAHAGFPGEAAPQPSLEAMTALREDLQEAWERWAVDALMDDVFSEAWDAWTLGQPGAAGG